MTTSNLRGYTDASGKSLLNRASWIFWQTIALIFVVTTCGGFGSAGAQTLSEYQAKAAYLFNFVKFIEWPASTFADENSPLVIGVVGVDRDSAVIEQTINGKVANGRRLVVKRFTSFRELTFCHIVFVRSSESDRVRQTVAAAGQGALTVGETQGFAQWGGIINLTVAEGKLRLEINQTSAEKAGLKISAKLLSLARVIRN